MKFKSTTIGLWATTLPIFTAIISIFVFVPMAQPAEIILDQPTRITGNKDSIQQLSYKLPDRDMENKSNLIMVLDLNGLCLLPAHASAVILTDSDKKNYEVSLSSYDHECFAGDQTINIPLTDFSKDQLMSNLDSITLQFWYTTTYMIDIKRIEISRVQSTPMKMAWATMTKNGSDYLKKSIRIAPTPIPQPASWNQSRPRGGKSWAIQSVSSMKETKDRVCNQRNITFINKWIDKAKELGVTHISVETPYDDPPCGSALKYTKRWVDAIHAKGIKVWHRHVPLAFEGIYSTPKDNSTNYLSLIENYIKDNPTLFRSGDIFTPITQPQNGGIAGITYCSFKICMFSGRSAFNSWLRNAMTVSENAFKLIKLAGQIKIGYYGFDGFVAWGDNNPDWKGILDNETIKKMGNITIDHFPEIVGDTMVNDLRELEQKYPKVPIIIGEWGTIMGGDTEQQVLRSMGASVQPNIVGFNYWHMGMDGNEALVNEDFSNKVDYDEVQSFYR